MSVPALVQDACKDAWVIFPKSLIFPTPMDIQHCRIASEDQVETQAETQAKAEAEALTEALPLAEAQAEWWRTAWRTGIAGHVETLAHARRA